ncbi:flavodoxin [Eubacteriaceae bacterium ES3]|nr:flavodoxin [Eubacteriaceae bacterium ES3]
MKTLIVYFSHEGNMDLVARNIAANQAAELYRLIPSKEYPTGKVSKYVWGGKSATFAEKPRLTNEAIDLKPYEVIIIGTPVWASTVAPPLNTFFSDYQFSDKKIILLATHRGGSPKKCLAKMEENLSDNEIIGSFEFTEPKDNQGPQFDEKIQQIRQLIL